MSLTSGKFIVGDLKKDCTFMTRSKGALSLSAGISEYLYMPMLATAYVVY